MATQKKILDSEGLQHLLSQLHDRQLWDKGLSELDFTQALKDEYAGKPNFERDSSSIYTPPSYTEKGHLKNPKTNNVIYPYTQLDRVVDFPKGTKKGQVLTYDGTKPAWADTLSDEVILNSLTYGVSFNFMNNRDNTLLKRIGSPELHKNLPVHSQFRGCIYWPDIYQETNGKGLFRKWLNPGDWTKRGLSYKDDDIYYGPQTSFMYTIGKVRFKFWLTRDDEVAHGYGQHNTYHYLGSEIQHFIYDAETLNSSYTSHTPSGLDKSTINFPSKYNGKLCISGLIHDAFFMLGDFNSPQAPTVSVYGGDKVPTDLNPVALKGMEITIVTNNKRRYTYKVLDVILSCNGDVAYDQTIHGNRSNSASEYPVTIVLDTDLVEGSTEYQDVISDASYFLVEECLNGYYGPIKVLTPDFYIRVKDLYGGVGAKGWEGEVRVSTLKINSDFQHQPPLYLDAYKVTVLNEVPENMGWLSMIPSGSAVSIANNSTYCRGGDGTTTYDTSTDPFQSNLGKCKTGVSLSSARQQAAKTAQNVMLFNQYKNLAWLFVIEYATFNMSQDYNPALTSEGYHQGGLGNGCTNIGTTESTYKEFEAYNNCNPLIPNGYTNDIGNGTGIKSVSIPVTSSKTVETTAVRWRGIEGIFGDTATMVDGLLGKPDKTCYQINDANTGYRQWYWDTSLYTSDNPRVSSDRLENMDSAGKVTFYSSENRKPTSFGGNRSVLAINTGDSNSGKSNFTPTQTTPGTYPNQNYGYSVWHEINASSPTIVTAVMGNSYGDFSQGNMMNMNLSRGLNTEVTKFSYQYVIGLVGYRTVCLASEVPELTLFPDSNPQ